MNVTDRITHLRRKIYVHSTLYYRFCTSIIEDSTFDKWAYELAELQRAYPEESKTTLFAAEFAGWDGTTGYDLPWNSWAVRTAEYLREMSQSDDNVYLL